jgi:hypothetical protein
MGIGLAGGDFAMGTLVCGKWLRDAGHTGFETIVANTVVLGAYIGWTALCWFIDGGTMFRGYASEKRDRTSRPARRQKPAGNDNDPAESPSRSGYFDASVGVCSACGKLTGVYLPACVSCGSRPAVVAEKARSEAAGAWRDA